MTNRWLRALAMALAVMMLLTVALAEAVEEISEPLEAPVSEVGEFSLEDVPPEESEADSGDEATGDGELSSEPMDATGVSRLTGFSDFSIAVGQTITLNIPVSGTQYKSSNKKVATVGLKTGVVKGIKAGTATIGARVPGYGDYFCTVTVTKAVTKVKLSASKLELGIGESRQLTARLSPSGASTELTWASSNTRVAEVDEDGEVTAVGAGKATIGVRTANGKIAKCTVTVTARVTDISFDRDEAVLNVKDTLQLNVYLEPEGVTSALIFRSSNTSVAAVTSKGKVTAKKAGYAVIGVRTANGLTATCAITVTGSTSPTRIALSETRATMTVGEVKTLDTALQPSDAKTTLSWSSSNSKVASVDDGEITALKSGSATITVRTANGKKATCRVTVKAAPAKLAVKAAKTTLKVGETTTVTANASGVYWTSDGDAVIVDSRGRVTALEPGEASVWAETSTGQIAGVIITVQDSGRPQYDDEDEDEDEDAQGEGYIIDISKYQGNVNFDKLAPHVSLVILRASLSTDIDSMFTTYAKALNARGIPFGVYCYSKASTASKAQSEAVMLYRYASSYGPKFYVLDAEYSTMNQTVISAFATALRKLGADKIGCYIAHNYYKKFGYDDVRDLFDFTWIPRYGKNDGTLTNSTRPAYECDLWQYTSSGTVPGISGKVDMNVITGQGKSLSWFIR